VRNRIFSKRRVAIIGASVAIALAGGGAAFAYFTSTGTGTGTGTVAATTAPYTVVVSAPDGGPISPGSSGETFTYSVENSDTGAQTITTAAISVTPDATALAAGCLGSWYQVSGPGIATTGNPATQTYTTPISIGGGDTSTNAQQTFTLSLTDTSSNQDGCEGDTPTVSVTVS
jgi:hypothetical protein